MPTDQSAGGGKQGGWRSGLKEPDELGRAVCEYRPDELSKSP
jgi:hypothetical protein